MAKQRTDRLNSLLREVISDVIRKNVRDPKIPELMSVTRVDITKDLAQAKVYVSFVTESIDVKAALGALKGASGFIGSLAAKQVVIRRFPSLTFHLDDTVSKQMRIESLLTNIHEEKEHRQPTQDDAHSDT